MEGIQGLVGHEAFLLVLNAAVRFGTLDIAQLRTLRRLFPATNSFFLVVTKKPQEVSAAKAYMKCDYLLLKEPLSMIKRTNPF